VREERLFLLCYANSFQKTQVIKFKSTMGSSTTFFSVFFLAFAILAVHVAQSSPSTLDFTGDLSTFLLPLKSGCRGSVAECGLLVGQDDDAEFLMDSETSRRILAGRTYISYGALRRNTVPCSRRGASYYNCRPGAQANPYSRGCSAITRCRRWGKAIILLILFLIFNFCNWWKIIVVIMSRYHIYTSREEKEE